MFSYFLIGGAYQSLALEVGFINATTPVWVLVIGFASWKKTPSEDRARPEIQGLMLAFIGTLIIISKGRLKSLTSLRFNLGNLWSLLAAMSFAWFSLRVRELGRTIPALPLTVLTAWGGLLLVMLPVYLVWLLLGGSWFALDRAGLAFALTAIAYIGLLPTMVGNLLYLYGVASVGAARAAAFLYLSPLFSASLAIGWLGERIAWYHAVGLAGIFAGLYLLRKSRRTIRAPRPEIGRSRYERDRRLIQEIDERDHFHLTPASPSRICPDRHLRGRITRAQLRARHAAFADLVGRDFDLEHVGE